MSVFLLYYVEVLKLPHLILYMTDNFNCVNMRKTQNRTHGHRATRIKLVIKDQTP